VNYATDVSPVVVDIETVGLPNASDYLEPIPDAVPDLTPVEADKRLTDPVKIAADMDKKVAARAQANLDAQAKVEARRADRLGRLGLDWNVGRIVAIGYWTETGGLVTRTCMTEETEAFGLGDVWKVARNRTIITFNGRNFDLPFMAQRSRYLGIPHPTLDLRPYEGGRGNIDLWLELTFGRKETPCMRTTLGAFCKRFGIEHDDSISGKDIGALVAAGEWEKVEAHVKADVLATVALARRLRIIQQAPELVTF
jgi:DNA polymerase elongation subunit (family B)